MQNTTEGTSRATRRRTRRPKLAVIRCGRPTTPHLEATEPVPQPRAPGTPRTGEPRLLFVANTYAVWPEPMRPGEILCLWIAVPGVAVLRYVDGKWKGVHYERRQFADWARLASFAELVPVDMDDAQALARLAASAVMATPVKGAR